MVRLLIKNPFNLKLKNEERLQIGFEKKYKVERIFNEQLEDIYYKKNKNSKEYQRTGTLFLDYLSDSVAEIFENLIDDICKKTDFKEIETKYLNAYVFYFRYFFTDKYKISSLEQIENLDKSKQNEIKKAISNEIRKIEDSKTINELVEQYTAFRKGLGIRGDKVEIGSKIVKRGTSTKDIRYKALKGEFGGISQWFIDKSFIKQIYKLLVENCYLKENTANVNKSPNDIKSRYFYFKEAYEKLITNKDEDIYCKLTFILPPAIAYANEKGQITYCYQIDEIVDTKGKELLLTNRFFSISLLQLLESGNKISKCKNCKGYFILKKTGTNYCNNPSPQSNNQSCSEYMKSYNHKERLNSDKIKKEIAKEEKRARDRKASYQKSILDLEKKEHQKKYEEEMKEWKKEQKEQKQLYQKGEITLKEYIEWLKNSNRIRTKKDA